MLMHFRVRNNSLDNLKRSFCRCIFHFHLYDKESVLQAGIEESRFTSIFEVKAMLQLTVVQKKTDVVLDF